MKKLKLRAVVIMCLCGVLMVGCAKTTTVRLLDLEEEMQLEAARSESKSVEETAETGASETVWESEAPTLQTEPNGVSEETVALDETTTVPEEQTAPGVETYILNESSKKIHYPDCSAVKKMANKNKREYNGTVEALEKLGYTPCGICHPGG